MQQYLREQVLAVLERHNEIEQSKEHAPSKPSPDSSFPNPSVQEVNLPGPDPDVGAPVIDEDTYRRAKLVENDHFRRTGFFTTPTE